jgi:hypothetical protein
MTHGNPRHRRARVSPSSGGATTLRFAGGGNLKPYLTPESAIAPASPAVSGSTPRSASTRMGRRAASSRKPASSRSRFQQGRPRDMGGFFWPRADISIQEGDEATGSFTTRLTGKVADATGAGSQAGHHDRRPVDGLGPARRHGAICRHGGHRGRRRGEEPDQAAHMGPSLQHRRPGARQGEQHL